jgi:hypothetical protein
VRSLPGTALKAAATLALLLLLCPLAARGREGFDPRVRELFRRAYAGEKPTEEDQRLATRMLRDWELSERTAPLDEPPHIRYLLRSIVDGEPVRSPQLRTVAQEITRRYLTREGFSRRMKYGPYGAGRPGGGDAAASFEPPDSSQDWFLFLACLVIMIGGIVIWFLGRRRNRPDYRIYYS